MTTFEETMKPVYDELMSSLNEIDATLDAADGSKTGGRRKVINRLMEANEDSFTPVVTQVTEHLNTLEEAQRVAVYFGIIKKLQSEFDKSANSYVEALVDAQPTQEVIVSDEEKAQLSQARKAMYDKVMTIINLAADMFEGVELDAPKPRRASSGPRGKRAMSLLTYYINGEEVEDQTYSQIAKDHGYETGGEFTKALRDAGYDTRTVTEITQFTMPDGTVLNASLDEDEDSDED